MNIRHVIDKFNKDKRLLVTICVDTSASMRRYVDDIPDEYKNNEQYQNDGVSCVECDFNGQSVMDLVNDEIVRFYKAIYNDPTARRSCDISTIAFKDKMDDVNGYVEDYFSNVDSKLSNHIIFEAADKSGTFMSDALNLALDNMEKRREEYRQAKVRCHKIEWLIIFTDGDAEDDVNAVQERIRDLEREKKLVVCAIGPRSSERLLSKFSNSRKTTKYIDMDNIEELHKIFVNLAKSVAVTSRGFTLQNDDDDDF